MNYKPTKKKLIYLSMVAIWYVFVSVLTGMTLCSCLSGGFDNCTDYQFLSILQSGCHCGCKSLFSVAGDYLLVLLPPSLIYIAVMPLKSNKNNL